MGNATIAQYQIQVGGKERPLTGFIDNDLTVDGRDFGYDLPPGFTASEDPSAWTAGADSSTNLFGAPQLTGGQVAQDRL